MKIGVPRKSRTTSTGWRSPRPASTSWSRTATRCSSRRGAGEGSSIADDEYVAAGREHRSPTPTRCGATAELVLKVKEPIAEEYRRLRADQVLFTYLHLAADRGADPGAASPARSPAIAYETVQLPAGALPLLYPMSEVAGGWRRRSGRTRC